MKCNCPPDVRSDYCTLTWEELNDKIDYADDIGWVEHRLELQRLKSRIVCKICMRLEDD